ncbi:unnamed protein product [Gongylonema pulchrum]|uniref:Uncharacterized protein n=1 Tax=Gongylonema pulchrum TaxID=637853 RepID=A0A183EXX1_9BILA|nr:unnamed protein product [Gongylonema pulchrum]
MSPANQSGITTNCSVNIPIPASARSNGGVLQRRLPQIPPLNMNVSFDQKSLEDDLPKLSRIPPSAEHRYIIANRR